MGNCFTIICRDHDKVSCCGVKKHKLVQVVKMDEQIIEFSMPILVKDVLLNFSGFVIAQARKAGRHLPPNYRLGLGGRYYLIPSVGISSETADEDSSNIKEEKEESSGGVKRIKVVITKKQLEELLSRQDQLDVDVLSRINESKKSNCSVVDQSSLTCWKPMLESIPEENELICTR